MKTVIKTTAKVNQSFTQFSKAALSAQQKRQIKGGDGIIIEDLIDA